MSALLLRLLEERCTANICRLFWKFCGHRALNRSTWKIVFESEFRPRSCSFHSEKIFTGKKCSSDCSMPSTPVGPRPRRRKLSLFSSRSPSSLLSSPFFLPPPASPIDITRQNYEVGIYSPALYSHVVRLDNIPTQCNNTTPLPPRDTGPPRPSREIAPPRPPFADAALEFYACPPDTYCHETSRPHEATNLHSLSVRLFCIAERRSDRSDFLTRKNAHCPIPGSRR